MKKTLSINTKANLIALAVMALILGIGIIYGLQLSNSFYLTENY
jgi:predicted RND superfamily exporter protein